MLDESEKLWFSLGPTDWLEAFSHHPRIGQKTALNKWTSQEQAGVGAAQEATLKNLIKFNEEYEAKFDHVFLICATGKPAAEMLKALQERIQNSPEQELKNACVEQSKITKIRLQKLLGEP